MVKRHNLKAPQGVRGRNSDNSRLREVLGWEPSIPLKRGLAVTFDWIAARVHSKVLSASAVAD
jgi:nucleoside-diphosphate-sugar epimerase